MICKFTALDEDVARESKVLLDLWREPALKGVVGPVELVKVKSHQQVWGPVAAMGGQSTAHLEHILLIALCPNSVYVCQYTCCNSVRLLLEVP